MAAIIKGTDTQRLIKFTRQIKIKLQESRNPTLPLQAPRYNDAHPHFNLNSETQEKKKIELN
jgi:hypothetical protein